MLFVFFLAVLFASVRSFYIQPRDYVRDAPMVAGLDVVGCGFDVTTLRSKHCLIDLDRSSGISSWIDPSNSSAVFHVPHGFFAFSQSELLSIDRSVLVQTIHSYFAQSIYTIQQDKSGFLGFGSSHRTKEIGEIYERIYKNTNSLIFTLRQIVWYNLMLATFPPPTLSPMAQNALNGLPMTFDASDANNVLKFRQFFHSFGTHIVTDADMGGLVWAQDWFQSCMLRVRNESWITEQVRKKYDPLGFFSSSSSTYHKTLILDETFQNSTTTELSLLGGTESIPIEQWKEWIPTIKYQPRPVSYRLQPIYTVLPQDSQHRETLMSATEHLRTETAADATQYIERLQSVPDPPSPTCPTSRRKRSITFEITPEARAVLCPYSSYTGETCSGAPQSLLLSGRQLTENSNKMLRSVGMGLDIATGDIKFMALNLTYDESKLSTVPSTGRSLVTFNEVIFQHLHPADDTKPLNRTFGSVEEIIMQWDNVRDSGEIAGGEFSRLLNTQEYRALFHSENYTIIEVTQQPYPVYRLKVDRSKAQLNSFAQYAVSQLTTEYSYDLYARFFNTFGTHIILRTVMGGMVERRVKRPHFLYPPPELCSSSFPQLCDNDQNPPIYRKFPRDPTILSDKRLGGAVDAADEQAWKNSIDLYPAVLKVLDFASWSEFANDPSVKENLNRAIQQYMQNAKASL